MRLPALAPGGGTINNPPAPIRKTAMKKYPLSLFTTILLSLSLCCTHAVAQPQNNCSAARTTEVSEPASEAGTLLVDTERWLSSGNCGAHALITVERPSPERLVQKQQFNQGGSSNPQLLNFFSYCIAGYFATRDGYTHMALEAPKDRKLVVEDERRVITFMLRKADTTGSTSTTSNTSEDDENFIPFADARQNCSKLLAEAYRW